MIATVAVMVESVGPAAAERVVSTDPRTPCNTGRGQRRRPWWKAVAARHDVRRRRPGCGAPAHGRSRPRVGAGTGNPPWSRRAPTVTIEDAAVDGTSPRTATRSRCTAGPSRSRRRRLDDVPHLVCAKYFRGACAQQATLTGMERTPRLPTLVIEREQPAEEFAAAGRLSARRAPQVGEASFKAGTTLPHARSSVARYWFAPRAGDASGSTPDARRSGASASQAGSAPKWARTTVGDHRSRPAGEGKP